jgi:hypothetical protein
VLRELHLVLALLHQPVAIRLGVGLREEWTNILANVLGQGPPSLLSESFTSAILASGEHAVLHKKKPSDRRYSYIYVTCSW